MRCGVLIIGSLIWDNGERSEWRRMRLSVHQRFTVGAPIHYGRISPSRGFTFTMTFASDGRGGRAALVPCKAAIGNVNELVAEAEALWRAERGRPKKIGASWGCVGVLFHPDREARHGKLRMSWSVEFGRTVNRPIWPVDDKGVLGIPWPRRTDNGELADIDVILATATEPERNGPSAVDIANGWLDKGYEEYFFKNVQSDIRTPDDDSIWQTIKKGKPDWLRKDEYRAAIDTLQI